MNRHLIATILGCFLWLLPSLAAEQMTFADSIASWSTDFWICSGHQVHSYVYICSRDSATVTMEYFGADHSTTSVHLNPYSQYILTIPKTNIDNELEDEIVSRYTYIKSCHITSTSPIACFSAIGKSYGQDVTRLLPTRLMDKEYQVINPYNNYSSGANSEYYYIVIATEDNTQVHTCVKDFTLNKGDFQIVYNYNSITETLYIYEEKWSRIQPIIGDLWTTPSVDKISSNHPIVVFQYGNYRTGSCCCNDTGWEQLLPISQYGTLYAVTTDIGTLSGKNTATLLTTDLLSNLSKDASYSKACEIIQSSEPVGLTLVCNSEGGETFGDPAYHQQLPWSHRMNHGVVYCTGGARDGGYGSRQIQQFINIVAETSGVAGMTLDCEDISGYFTPVSRHAAYSYAQIEVDKGIHYLDNKRGTFLATAFQGTVADECFYAVSPTLGPPIRDRFDTICRTDSILFGGQYRHDEGLYYDTTYYDDCYTTIECLHLTVSAVPTTQPFDTTVCDTLLPYKWYGRIYYGPATYTDTLHNSRGCDSLYRPYTLDTIHCVRPEPPVPPEPECGDSLVYRKWDDVLFCDDGLRQFIAYQWYRDEQMMSGETNQYLYLPGGQMGTASYGVVATRRDGSRYASCSKPFYDWPRSADTYVQVQTFVRRGGALRIDISDDCAEVEIYSTLGQRVLSASITGPQYSLPIYLPAGAYVLRLQGDRVSALTKILVE